MKHSEDKVVQTINVNPDDVWDVISSVGGVDKWFSSVIATCKVDGSNRYCTTVDGHPLNEKILEINHESRTFRYAIPNVTMLPVQNFEGTMQVSADKQGKTQFTWTGSFQVQDTDESMVRETLTGLWNTGIKDLEAYVQSK